MTEIAETTTETTPAAPTYGEKLRAILPSHAHVKSAGLFSFRATWTTPAATWLLIYEAPVFFGPRKVTIRSGANVLILENPALDDLYAHLRLLGAIAPADTDTTGEPR